MTPGRTISLSPDLQSLSLSTPAGTSLRLPLCEASLALIHRLLMGDKRAEVQRAMANRASADLDKNRLLADAMALGVGSDASPVQYDIDKWLRGEGPEPLIRVLTPIGKARPQSGKDFSLEDLGL